MSSVNRACSVSECSRPATLFLVKISMGRYEEVAKIYLYLHIFGERWKIRVAGLSFICLEVNGKWRNLANVVICNQIHCKKLFEFVASLRYNRKRSIHQNGSMKNANGITTKLTKIYHTGQGRIYVVR